MNTSHRACRILPAKARKTRGGTASSSLTRHPWLYLVGAILMMSCLNAGMRGQASSAGKEEKQSKTAGSEWSDVLLVEQPEPTISYRGVGGV